MLRVIHEAAELHIRQGLPAAVAIGQAFVRNDAVTAR